MSETAVIKFSLVYRVSNTGTWVAFGEYPTREAAVAARKAAVRSGYRAPATATTQGKILGWNIIPFTEEALAQGRYL